jgi:putative phosphoesterase
MVTVGVISDTHVPDRRRELSPAALEAFAQRRVEAILHAGDVSVPRVLDQLREVAPVHAVRGNRDWLALRGLPAEVCLAFGGAQVGLTHGHGRLWNYLYDKVKYVLRGYEAHIFERRVLSAFPDVQAVVFGHTHRTTNRRVSVAGGHSLLLFNPGSPHFPEEGKPPSVGLLHCEAGRVEGEIVFLE